MMMTSLLLVLLATPSAQAAVVVDPPAVSLHGPGASHSLLVSASRADGQWLDRTHSARYASTNPAVASVSPRGVIHAVADGRATISVRLGDELRQVPVEVRDSASPREYHFGNDIVPLLSRFGCNGSGCHGKAEGQNGFKLSVFGFDPQTDLTSLIKEGRGRRVLPGAPESSLLVRKMSGLMPHGGGGRIRPGTLGYDTIVGWIAAGMPAGRADAPRVESVRVEPGERVLDPGGTQQLRVMARYSDGRQIDVTAQARFHTNNEALASVDAEGLVTVGETPGEGAIMASFMNAIATSRILVPRRERLARFPDLPENNFIDRLVHARLRKLHILPSDSCDDATYLRRVYLDVIGTLPTAGEVRRFLEDRRPDKRAKWVEDLLKRPEFVDYWAMKWADVLRVDRSVLGAKQARAYHQWIRERLASATPLDQFARELLVAEGPVDEMAPASFYKAVRKPGDMASTLAQVFLGVRIACAECHHHPFDRWSQDDYHGMAAFFSGVRLGKGPAGETVSVEGIASARQPRSGETILAHPLGEKMPEKLPPGDQRQQLALWWTRPGNPYFARNIANRVWAHFLGRGLVEPLDDVRETNPPSNPELLDALAQELSDRKFDLPSLIRTITASRAYQRATTPNATNEGDTINYSRALLRRVPAEVLLDMICQVTGVPERFAGAPPGTRAIQLWDSKVPHYFLKAFGRTERTSACECERNPEPSVAQVLHLLNSPEIEGKLGHAAGALGKLERQRKDDAELVEELYLTVYARRPLEKEKSLAVEHLRKNAGARRQAVEDLAWGLINALEFSFNH